MMLWLTRGAAAFFLLGSTPLVQATITIMDTGERFASRQDDEYGPLLWKGYQYAGRLQMINGNLPLCPSRFEDENFNTTLVIPPDGLPVALLGREGGCSTLEKLRYIQKYVKPANLVHYLILDGSTSHHHHSSAAAPTKGGPFPNDMALVEQATDDCINVEDCLKKRDESIPIHVLHVSFRTEYKLLDYLLQQSSTMKKDGGPRLAIDSKINVHSLSDNVALAVAALTLLAACLCSLGLLIQGNRNGWWEPPPQTPPQPRRNRRRLRREQVKELLPVYRFNGQELEIIPEEMSTTPLLDAEGNPTRRVPPLLPAELDCCPICLDEYEEGDRVRCIDPCNHTFHSKCIGKWLVERSATCPLCKFDLYDSDDEEESVPEDQRAHGAAAGTVNTNPENAGITHFHATLPLDILEQQQQQQQQDPSRSFWHWVWRSSDEPGEPSDQGNEEPTLTLLEDQQENNQEEATRLPRQRRPWWQRMLRRREPAAESLTEPLLMEQGETASASQDVETPAETATQEAAAAPAPLEMGPEASVSAAAESVTETAAE